MTRVWMLLLSWLGLFLIVVGIDLVLPKTFWGALAALPFNLVVAPISYWLGLYFLRGPAAAHEWLGHLVFVVKAWPEVKRFCDEEELENHLRNWRTRR